MRIPPCKYFWTGDHTVHFRLRRRNFMINAFSTARCAYRDFAGLTGDHTVPPCLRHRNFTLTLSLQPGVPTGFLNGLDWWSRRPFPARCFFLGTESSEMKSTNSFFLFFFIFFFPLYPPLVLVPVLHVFTKSSQKEGQVLKEFHETPEGATKCFGW